MNRVTGWLMVGAAALCVAVGVRAEEMPKPEEAPKKTEEAPKKKKGTFQAQRAGWMLGMYIGEEKGFPYPFVLQVDPESDAKAKGIRQGDELIRFDDQETSPLSRVFDRVNRLRPGRHITLWMRRGSQTLQFEIRVPRDPGAGPGTGEREEKKKAEKKDEQSADGQDKKEKKKEKKPPVVVKPIPADE
jgi:predicted metalloprotease with PDZ domain